MSETYIYIPSPISVDYTVSYKAIANKSGRMQYYRENKGKSRVRIGRADFIKAYNSNNIIGIKPIQSRVKASSVFQFEFFIVF